MTPEAQRALAAELDAAVRRVPGISELFQVGGWVAQAWAVGAHALTGGDDPVSPVKVTSSADDGVVVELAVGVSGSPGAVDTSAIVSAVVRDTCAAHGAPDTHLRLTVVMVDDLPAR